MCKWLALCLMLATPALADRFPGMDCKYRFRGTQVECTADHVDPYNVVWEVEFHDEVVQREYNLRSYLTLSRKTYRIISLYVVVHGEKRLVCSVRAILKGNEFHYIILKGKQREAPP